MDGNPETIYRYGDREIKAVSDETVRDGPADPESRGKARDL